MPKIKYTIVVFCTIFYQVQVFVFIYLVSAKKNINKQAAECRETRLTAHFLFERPTSTFKLSVIVNARKCQESVDRREHDTATKHKIYTKYVSISLLLLSSGGPVSVLFNFHAQNYTAKTLIRFH